MKPFLIALVTIETAVLIYLFAVPPDPSLGDPMALDTMEAPDSGPELHGSTGSEEAVDGASDTVATPEPDTAPTEAVVFGRITDTDGKRMPGRVSCGVVTTKGKVYEAFYRKVNGQYARAGIPPGVHSFRSLAKGYAMHDTLIEIPEGVAKVEHSIQMQRLIEIPIWLVTPEGAPLRNAIPGTEEWLARSLSVIAASEAPPARLRATKDAAHLSFGRSDYTPSGKEREAHLKDGRDGTLRIRGELPIQVGVYFRRERLRVLRIKRPMRRLKIRIEPETLQAQVSGVTFRLTGASDASELEDVLVMLHDTDTADDPAEDTVKRDGDKFTITNHPPGNLLLQIHAGESLAPYVRNVDLPPGGVLDLGTIHLGLLTKQKLRIVDSEDEPVIGATLWPYELDVGWVAQSGMPIRFTSDAKGIVRLALGTHHYGLLIREPGRGWASVALDLREEQPEVVDVTLPMLVPVTIRTGDVELPVSVRIFESNDRVVTARRLKSPTLWPIALAAGDYRMIITDRDGNERTEQMKVTDPMTKMVVIE